MTDLELLPIRIPNIKLQNKLESHINQLFRVLSIDNHQDISLFEQEIDNLVYRLYDLTYAEIKIIDPEIENKISEAEYNAIKLE